MALISGLQICTSGTTERAEHVISAMESLLRSRRYGAVSRPVFRVRWNKLRLRLFMTVDYQELIDRVATRASGRCEMCYTGAGVHVHHIKPVAFFPRLALVDTNCRWVCKACHSAADPKARAEAIREKQHFAHAALDARPRWESRVGPRKLGFS